MVDYRQAWNGIKTEITAKQESNKGPNKAAKQGIEKGPRQRKQEQQTLNRDPGNRQRHKSDNALSLSETQRNE